MRSAGTVEHAFFDEENREAKGITVQHCATNAAAGAGTGDEQTIDVLAHQISDQVGAEKSTGAGLADDEFIVSRPDHLAKIDREFLEVGFVHTAFGGVAEGGLEFGIAGGVDHGNFSITTGVEQLLYLRRRVPGYLATTGGEFVYGIHHRHRLCPREAGNHVDNQERGVDAKFFLALVTGFFVNFSFLFRDKRFPISHYHISYLFRSLSDF